MPTYYIANMPFSDELYHHGILGQKWGIRRYQNPDGSLTEEGRKRYASPEAHERFKSKIDKAGMAYGREWKIAENAVNSSREKLREAMKQYNEVRFRDERRILEAISKKGEPLQIPKGHLPYEYMLENHKKEHDQATNALNEYNKSIKEIANLLLGKYGPIAKVEVESEQYYMTTQAGHKFMSQLERSSAAKIAADSHRLEYKIFIEEPRKNIPNTIN